MKPEALDKLVELLRYLIGLRCVTKDDYEYLERKLNEFVEACDEVG
jgi:coenzyme F420-reducing hydrogenase beta subunit